MMDMTAPCMLHDACYDLWASGKQQPPATVAPVLRRPGLSVPFTSSYAPTVPGNCVANVSADVPRLGSMEPLLDIEELRERDKRSAACASAASSVNTDALDHNATNRALTLVMVLGSSVFTVISKQRWRLFLVAFPLPIVAVRSSTKVTFW